MTHTLVFVCAAVAMIHSLQLVMCFCTSPEVSPWQTDMDGIVRLTVSSSDGFDDSCDDRSPVWRNAYTKAVCFPSAIHIVGKHFRRSAQTALTTVVSDEDEVPISTANVGCAAEPRHELTLTRINVGRRLEHVGLSRRLYRRECRRHACLQTLDNDDAPVQWWVIAAAMAVGVCEGINPVTACAAWIFSTASIGLYWLATDKHFWLPICMVLSFNFWCAATWITWAVNPVSGGSLLLIAVVSRRSPLLFPSQDGVNSDQASPAQLSS